MSEPEEPDATWAVWRTDDTGNTFLVRAGLTHEAAQQLAAEFEARGHKQTYFVEKQK
jgi:UDP-N-acetyl-2-amino-2-deoxyglucuronate dehydrogenase